MNDIYEFMEKTPNDEETYYDLEAPVYDVFVREYDNHEEDNKGHKDQTLFLYVVK